jgi:hypothetical protein
MASHLASALVGGVLVLLVGLAGCRRHRTAEDAFREEPARFERLRDMILAEPACSQVWTDHYEWVDPCNVGACTGAPAPSRTGRPPGVAARACDWPYGCSRWIDDRPTAAIVAGVCGMPLARAEEYLDRMRSLGALRLYRGAPGDDEATFVTAMTGLSVSGGETAIVWRSAPPPALSGGTPSKGHEYRWLGSSGWYVKREWN